VVAAAGARLRFEPVSDIPAPVTPRAQLELGHGLHAPAAAGAARLVVVRAAFTTAAAAAAARAFGVDADLAGAAAVWAGAFVVRHRDLARFAVRTCR
jgi:hypothetical protein